MNDELDVMSRLVDYHDHISAPSVPVADDVRRGRRRVRRNRGLLAGGAALGLASVVAVVSLLTAGLAADRPQPAGPTGLTTTTFVSPTNGFAVGYLDRGDVTVTAAKELWGLGERGDGFDVVEIGSAAVFTGASTKIPDGVSVDEWVDEHVSPAAATCLAASNRRSPSMGSRAGSRNVRTRSRRPLSPAGGSICSPCRTTAVTPERSSTPSSPPSTYPGGGGRHPGPDDDLRLADLRVLLRVSRQRGARTGHGALGSRRRAARHHPVRRPIRCR